MGRTMKKFTILTSISLSLFMTLTGQNAFGSLSKHEEILARRALSKQGVAITQENMLELIEKVSSGKHIDTFVKEKKSEIEKEELRVKATHEALVEEVKSFEEKLLARLGIDQREDDDNLEDLEGAQTTLAHLTLLLDRVPEPVVEGGDLAPVIQPVNANAEEIEKLERIIENLTARLTGTNNAAENPVLDPQMTKVGASFTHIDDFQAPDAIDWDTEGPALQDLAQAVFNQLDPGVAGMSIFKTKIFGKPETALGAGDGRPSFVEQFAKKVDQKDLGELLSLIDVLKGNQQTKKADRGGVDAAIETLKLKIRAIEESAPPEDVRNNAQRYIKTQELLAMADGEQGDITEQLIKPLLTAFSESIETLGENPVEMGKAIYGHMLYLKNYGDTNTLLEFLGKVFSTIAYDASYTIKISTADGKNSRQIPANPVRSEAEALLKSAAVRDKFPVIKDLYGDLQEALGALAEGADESVTSPRQLIEASIDYNMAVQQFKDLQGGMGNFGAVTNLQHKGILTKLKTELLTYDRSGSITVLMADMLDQEPRFMSNNDITAEEKKFFQAGLSLIKKYKVISALNTKLGVFHS